MSPHPQHPYQQPDGDDAIGSNASGVGAVAAMCAGMVAQVVTSAGVVAADN
jgi:hypothetical protein